MNCTKCKEQLTAYIEGLLSESDRKAVEAHLNDCPPCRAELQQLSALQQRLTDNADAFGASDLENNVLNRIIREQNLKLRKADRLNRQFAIWRKIMNSRITKLAAAAVIIIAVTLSINLFDKTIPSAYALEQTIEAHHTVRYLHFKYFDVRHEDPKEFWIECDEFGQIKNVRFHMPEWDSPSDGAKIIVWQQDKVKVYFKKKNMLFVANDKSVADNMLKTVEQQDPRLIVERLYDLEDQGKAKTQIEEPLDKSKPIIMTAIYEDESKIVYFIDQATKLVTSSESYRLENGEYVLQEMHEYYDYNVAIDAKMFSLDDEVPADATVIDQTIQDVGLVQGNFSNEEIVIEVARQFFEALIAKDYAKAAKLYEGIPADKMQESFGKIGCIRIVSIGEPTPHKNPATRFLCVPCEIEIEAGGVKSIKRFVPNIREVFNQPGRWTIGGGI